MSLGQQPINNCNFDFSSVLTDVSTMLTVARLVENVGVGAYLGAAHLLSDPTILTAAASIVTVEARHQTMLNVFNNGQAIPNAFDLPLLPQEVLSESSTCRTSIMVSQENILKWSMSLLVIAILQQDSGLRMNLLRVDVSSQNAYPIVRTLNS